MKTDVGWCEVERPGDGVGVVVVRGEHDLTTAPEVSARLEALGAEARHVVLDVSQTTFLDSSILHVIYQFAARQRDAGRQIVLQLSTEPIVLRVLEVSGLLSELPCARSRDEAVALALAAD